MTMENIDLKNSLSNYKNVFLGSKRYWALYLLFITVCCFSIVSGKNLHHPKFELITFIVVAVLGIICILYYLSHNSDKELHKVAFVIILTFGIVCCLIVPMVNHIDEMEHFTRSEITSEGVIAPDWIGDEHGIDRLYNHTTGERSKEHNPNVGFNTIGSMKFFEKAREGTVFETTHDTDKINQSTYMRGSAFEQNPIYGYLPQAIGIFIAKLLDLNVVWMLWLARLANLICYAGIVSFAIKKTPCLKMPLIAIACIPVTLYHASSTSIDALIFALGILAIAYFLYLHESAESSLENKHIIIYSIICLLLGLCKLPYLAFIFLLLFIPQNRFKTKNYKILILLSIIAVGLCGVLWSKYSTPALMHSWRSSYNYVNSTQQLQYLTNNPSDIFKFLYHTVTGGLSNILPELFNYDYRNAASFETYSFIILALEVFLAIVLFAYPQKVKFDKKTKIGALLVFIIIYIGTFFVQLLTWANVGDMEVGVHMRYFIPLLALIPIIVQLNFNKINAEKFDKYMMVFIIGFMATLILAIAFRFY